MRCSSAQVSFLNWNSRFPRRSQFFAKPARLISSDTSGLTTLLSAATQEGFCVEICKPFGLSFCLPSIVLKIRHIRYLCSRADNKARFTLGY
jgi:hypothetical protein